jgi:hypothetical protein
MYHRTKAPEREAVEIYGLIKREYDIHTLAFSLVEPLLEYVEQADLPTTPATWATSKLWREDWIRKKPLQIMLRTIQAKMVVLETETNRKISSFQTSPFPELIDVAKVNVLYTPYREGANGEYSGTLFPTKTIKATAFIKRFKPRSLLQIRIDLMSTLVHEITHAIQHKMGTAPLLSLPIHWKNFLKYHRDYAITACEVEAHVEEAIEIARLAKIPVEFALHQLLGSVITVAQRRRFPLPMDPSITEEIAAEKWFQWWLENYIEPKDWAIHKKVWQKLRKMKSIPLLEFSTLQPYIPDVSPNVDSIPDDWIVDREIL